MMKSLNASDDDEIEGKNSGNKLILSLEIKSFDFYSYYLKKIKIKNR